MNRARSSVVRCLALAAAAGSFACGAGGEASASLAQRVYAEQAEAKTEEPSGTGGEQR